MNSALESSVTLEEVFAVVTNKRVPLAPELAGYLILEIAESSGGLIGDLDVRNVYISDEGSVALVRPKRDPSASGDTEGSIRAALQKLLDASGSSTPALAAAAKRASGGGLNSLAQELEAALIPVNRSAGRRALARLAREVKRITWGVGRNATAPVSERNPRSSAGELSRPSHPNSSSVGAISVGAMPAATNSSANIPGSDASASADSPPNSRDEVDSLLSSFEVSEKRAAAQVSRELKAIAGLDPTPAPPVQTRGVVGKATTSSRGGDGSDAGMDSLLSMGDDSPESVRRPSLSSSYSSSPSRSRLLATEEKREGGDRFLWALLLALIGAVGVLLWIFKPGLLSGRAAENMQVETSAEKNSGGGEAEREKAKESERLQAVAAERAKACQAALTVTNIPEDAEVLLRVGQAPVDVERMPVGARLEFVATAEGYLPQRSVIPAMAAWDNDPEKKPRFELAVQLERVRPRSRNPDAWPPAEPGSEVGGNGPPGTVHVVSTPRGAEIWLLTGMGPEAKIDQLPCEKDIDVLVAGPTSVRKRLRAKAGDFIPVADTRVPLRTAKISAH